MDILEQSPRPVTAASAKWSALKSSSLKQWSFLRAERSCVSEHHSSFPGSGSIHPPPRPLVQGMPAEPLKGFPLCYWALHFAETQWFQPGITRRMFYISWPHFTVLLLVLTLAVSPVLHLHICALFPDLTSQTGEDIFSDQWHNVIIWSLTQLLKACFAECELSGTRALSKALGWTNWGTIHFGLWMIVCSHAMVVSNDLWIFFRAESWFQHILWTKHTNMMWNNTVTLPYICWSDSSSFPSGNDSGSEHCFLTVTHNVEFCH